MSRGGIVTPTGERTLLLSVKKGTGIPVYHQVFTQIRDAISRGDLAPGTRLPSIRAMSADLGVSHITVEKAYLQLSVEGYVRSQARSGFVVEEIDLDFFEKEAPDNAEEIRAIMESWERSSTATGMEPFGACRYDFSYYNLAPACSRRTSGANSAPKSCTG